ncbi:MAG: YgaP-like transmembrane domain [Flavobacteriales bacterium]
MGLLNMGSILLTSQFGFSWIYTAIAVLQIASPFTKFCPVYTILNKLMTDTDPMQNGK